MVFYKLFRKSSLDNKYTHLTNTSINVNSSKYENDLTTSNMCKLSLKDLKKVFAEFNLPYAKVWKKIKDIVIKTFIAAEKPMLERHRQTN